MSMSVTSTELSIKAAAYYNNSFNDLGTQCSNTPSSAARTAEADKTTGRNHHPHPSEDDTTTTTADIHNDDEGKELPTSVAIRRVRSRKQAAWLKYQKIKSNMVPEPSSPSSVDRRSPNHFHHNGVDFHTRKNSMGFSSMTGTTVSITSLSSFLSTPVDSFDEGVSLTTTIVDKSEEVENKLCSLGEQMTRTDQLIVTSESLDVSEEELNVVDL